MRRLVTLMLAGALVGITFAVAMSGLVLVYDWALSHPSFWGGLAFMAGFGALFGALVHFIDPTPPGERRPGRQSGT